MIKSDLKAKLRDELVKDIIYTERVYEELGLAYIECSVWSATSGYSFKYTRKVSYVNNRVIQTTRKMFLQKVMKEKEKFSPRFIYTEDLDSIDVLLTDGFNYEEF